MKAVIFDMDGVIFDSEPIHLKLDQQLFEILNIHMSHTELTQYIGVTNHKMWSDLKQQFKLNETVPQLLEMSIKQKMEHLENNKIEPIAGIQELLQWLTLHEYKIGLASSSPYNYIEAVLRKLEIIDFFQVIVSGEHVIQSKPAPDIFLLAASKLHIETSQCLVIEDSTHGVHAAKAAQMTCFGFYNPNSGNQNLSQADYYIQSISEVKEILMKKVTTEK